jgi:hypothetical protein
MRGYRRRQRNSLEGNLRKVNGGGSNRRSGLAERMFGFEVLPLIEVVFIDTGGPADSIRSENQIKCF